MSTLTQQPSKMNLFEQIEQLKAENERLTNEMQNLIDILKKSAIRYKACFGHQNPGGEQIYEYHAMLLEKILNNPL